MKNYVMPVIAGVVGIACGLASNTPVLAGRWANLIVWAVAGLVLGLFVTGRRLILSTGLVYGFVMSVTFLLSGFQGSRDKLPAFLGLTLALSLVGAVGGLVTVFIGSWIRQRFR